MKYVLSACVGFLAVVALSLPSHGSFVSIAGLKNTGVNADNTVRAGESAELHYDLDAYPAGYSSNPGLTIVDLPSGASWIANTSTSKWISVGTQGQGWLSNDLSGNYEISLTFDLTGFNHTTALLSGRFASDNLASVKLNTTTIGNTTGGTPFSSWASFSAASSAFVSGMNTLVFSINNSGSTTSTSGTGNPMGLRVEFLSSTVQVPEPATMALWGMGAVGLAAFRFRRKK
jgi:hypothetical protein